MRSDWYLGICQGEERLKDENGKKVHTTQKPAELLYRVIISTTNFGDVVLDPFSGTGTTAVVAKRLGRKFIGIEKEEFYHTESLKRLEKVVPIEKELLEYKIEKKEPLVAFLALIEKGMIKIGQKLIDNKGNVGVINADGTITLTDEFVGSIHKTGAYLQNKPSCNGWTHWYLVMPKGEKQSIDLIRKMYKAKFL